MDDRTAPIPDVRALTDAERALVGSMLERSSDEARAFLPQLARASVVSRCPCGCPSIDFVVSGLAPPQGPLHVLADFQFHYEGVLSGVMVFEQMGVLGGLEVYALAGDTPRHLPTPGDLQAIDASSMAGPDDD